MNDIGCPVGEDDLQAFVDGRLNPSRAAEVERFLGEQPGLAQRVAAYRTQRAELAARLRPRAEQPVPARLRVAAIRAGRRHRLRSIVGQALAACLIFTVGLGSGLVASRLAGSERTASLHGGPALDLALAAHRMFAAYDSSPVEFRAQDGVPLSEWISGRLKHDLVLPDLSREGFRLVGARALPAGASTAAQIAYEDGNGRRLTLYVKTGETGTTSPALTERGGLSIAMWRDDGCAYALITQTDRDTLRRLSDTAFDQMEADDDKS